MTSKPTGGTVLIPTIHPKFADAISKRAFFTEDEGRFLKKFEQREQPNFCSPRESCKTNLYFGFFFDGTKNNYIDAETDNNHSNVARLYDCYPGLSVPNILPKQMDWAYKPEQFTNFFKVYIPGVASRFDAVADTGKGNDAMGGGAFGLYGERRIIWAMIQAINNLHRFFLKAPLIGSGEALSLVKRIVLNHERREAFAPPSLFGKKYDEDDRLLLTKKEFRSLLERLHRAIKQFMPKKNWFAGKVVDPGMVQIIHMSTFGFSRGATQARAFQNWMCSLCQFDAELTNMPHQFSLGGFPVSFDFLGLFDTVASVGRGNTLGNIPGLGRLNGHDAWADADRSLRVREGIHCVHLIAAHELRRSFPVDSISVKGVLPPKTWEIVIPGVHSDLGCGYSPMEQGKGTDKSGADMLARIPLVVMYRMARLAGVPLKPEFASPIAQARFAVAPKTITVLNNYLALCKKQTGSLTDIMREQARLQMEWRLSRRSTGPTPIEKTAFYQRSTMLDQNDFTSANLEFEEEIRKFEAWRADQGKRFVPETQDPGFDNDPEDEWEEIATWYKPRPTCHPAISELFDNYVHDSRAWFKLFPGNPDSLEKVHEQLISWVVKRDKGAPLLAYTASLKAANRGIDPRMQGKHFGGVLPEDKYYLTPAQMKAANEYTASGGKIPRMFTEGREPWGWKSRAGYLRFRKIYGGWDDALLSDAGSTVAPDNEQDTQAA